MAPKIEFYIRSPKSAFEGWGGRVVVNGQSYRVDCYSNGGRCAFDTKEALIRAARRLVARFTKVGA